MHPLDGIEDVDEARVERREAESQEVRRPEVSDHVAGDQRLHHRVGVLVGEGDLAAAQGGIARAGERQAEAGAARFDQLDEEL